MVAGDWWYETFITPVLRSRVPGSHRRVRDVRGVRCGVVIFGFSSYRAGILPRGASILVMLGGIAGAATLIVGSQILAVAVGWIGLSLIGPDGGVSGPNS